MMLDFPGIPVSVPVVVASSQQPAGTVAGDTMTLVLCEQTGKMYCAIYFSDRFVDARFMMHLQGRR